jgi:hypothetical protein
MKPISKSQSSKRNSRRFGQLNEPELPEYDSDKQWRIRLVKLELTGRYEVECRFRTRQGNYAKLRIDNSLRADFDRVQKLLLAHNACLRTKKRMQSSSYKN